MFCDIEQICSEIKIKIYSLRSLQTSSYYVLHIIFGRSRWLLFFKSNLMKNYEGSIKGCSSVSSPPIPTDYSSILVHQLRTENRFLKDQILRLEQIQFFSQSIPPKMVDRDFKEDDIQIRFSQRLEQIRNRSRSGNKSSQPNTPIIKMSRVSSISKCNSEVAGYFPRDLQKSNSRIVRHPSRHKHEPSTSSNSSELPLGDIVIINESTKVKSSQSDQDNPSPRKTERVGGMNQESQFRNTVKGGRSHNKMISIDQTRQSILSSQRNYQNIINTKEGKFMVGNCWQTSFINKQKNEAWQPAQTIRMPKLNNQVYLEDSMSANQQRQSRVRKGN